jgi:rhamnosyltransferase
MAGRIPGMNPGRSVTSITVAFNPQPARLAEQIAALRGQVGSIVIVDNASDPPVDEILRGLPPAAQGDPPVTVLRHGANLGVAQAYNVGVAEARRSDAGFALLLDHDSVPTPGMVAALLDGYRRGVADAGARPVAAVGPRVSDARDPREYPFIRLGWVRNRHVRCANEASGVISCDFLISSGTLVAVEHLPAIGEFDAALFIDSVDLEWCCRARSRGFALYGVCAAELDHRLGDNRRVFLSAFTLVVHSPRRLYYMTRNRLLLYQRAYVPLKWKLKDLLRVSAKFAATMLFVPPRREYARMTLAALRDGLARRGGRFGDDPP